jgi:DNA-binding transcriptional ArsR family regulator
MGDVDWSVVDALLSEPARARTLFVLADGRALPTSVLTMEAGISAAGISGQLCWLLDAGLVTVRQHGRYRYYRLAGPHVGELIEAMVQIAPSRAITSLREGTRAHAVRWARRCYNHLAGRVGVALTASFLDRGLLEGHNGSVDFDRMVGNRPAGGVIDPVAYSLTERGVEVLRALDVRPPTNRVVCCCVDWTEQRHHMAGSVGRVLLRQFEGRGWVRPSEHHRALVVTDAGGDALVAWFGIDADAPPAALF